MAGNAAGWWKFNGGKIDFTFNGIAPNESGSWYFRGGQLQFGYSGTVQWMGLNCTISGGKLVPVGVSGAIASRAASANSDTNWLIVTDTNACRTVVFYGQNGCWTAVKNLSCTPGKNSTPTVTGDFKEPVVENPSVPIHIPAGIIHSSTEIISSILLFIIMEV